MKDYLLTVKENAPIGKNAFLLTFSCDEELPPCSAGQFAQLEVPDSSRILRRPFCIYSSSAHEVSFAIAVKGEGTAALQRLCAGEKIKAILPLGKGFKLDDSDRKVVLLGAGMGCAPLYPALNFGGDRKFYCFLGFHDRQSIMFEEDFTLKAETYICTSDGSKGYKGHATELFCQKVDEIKPDVVLVCGPTSFMAAAQKILIEKGIKGYVSVEQRMGCGIGACLVCSCAVKHDGETHYKRVCADGPVFDVREIIL